MYKVLVDRNFHGACKEAKGLPRIYFFHLVFGKTVRSRHYSVTVSVESLAKRYEAAGAKVLRRLSKLKEAQVRRPARSRRA